MTDKEEDKLSTYYAVIASCAKHNTAWQSLPAFANGYGEFQTEVDAISAAAETQQAGITGAAKDKSARRQTLAEYACPVAASVQAWATLNDNATLAGRIAFTLSDFLYGRDTESEERARLVHTEATAILASLTDYGVTQQLLDDLLAAIDAYKATLAAPRAAITQAMAELAFPVAAAVHAWALENDNAQLADRVGFSMSDFLNGRDTIAEERAQVVHDEGQMNLAGLGDFGVTQQLLNDLQAAIEPIPKLKTTALTVRLTETSRRRGIDASDEFYAYRPRA
ncbi:MAG: hypothetical protein ACI8UO_005437 [Verrucomicrobiales bacterium]|jgi:hypothetical protein